MIRRNIKILIDIATRRGITFLAIMLLGIVLPLNAMELGLDMGFSRIEHHVKDTSGLIDRDQDHLPARAYIGLSARHKVSPVLRLGGKLIYNHRDYGEPVTGLEAKAAYLDLMPHPMISIKSLELYAGPTLAYRLNSSHSGGSPDYTRAMVEDFADLIPGYHLGMRFPAEFDLAWSLDLSYNRDLRPFSKALGKHKTQERLMLGVNYRFVQRDFYLKPILEAFRHINTEQRVNQGIAFSTRKEDLVMEINISMEHIKRFGPLGLGADFDLSIGSILPESDFGVWMKAMAGPQISFKLSGLEPYYLRSWGVVPMFVFAEDHPYSRLHASKAWESGLRLHLSRDVALDLRYREQTYHPGKEIPTYGISASVVMD